MRPTVPLPSSPTSTSPPPNQSSPRHRPSPTQLTRPPNPRAAASAPPAQSPASPAWPFSSASASASTSTRTSTDGLRADSYRDARPRPRPRPETALSGAPSSYRTALGSPALSVSVGGSGSGSPPALPAGGSGRPVSSGTFGAPNREGREGGVAVHRLPPAPEPERREVRAARAPSPPPSGSGDSSGRYDDADPFDADASLEASLLQFAATVTPPTDSSADASGSGTTSGWVRAQARELAQAEAEAALEEDSRAGDFPDSEYTLSHPSPPRQPESPAERLPPHYPPYPPGRRPPLRESPPSYPRAHPHNLPSGGPAPSSLGSGVAARGGLGAWLDYPQPQFFSSYAANGGSSWRLLGAGFDAPSGSPALTDLPAGAGGGRAARIQARREKLEKRQAREGERSAQAEEAGEADEQRRETKGEHLRRVEGREVSWSGADDKGRLLASRWPTVWRWTAAGLALAELIGLLAAKFMASPTTAPPQESKLTTYVLWALPFVSWLLAGYLHLLRPWLFRRRAIAAALWEMQHPPALEMSVPLLAQQPDLTFVSNGGGGGCCGRRANKPPPGMSKQEWAFRQRTHLPASQPTINLILNPAQLGLLSPQPSPDPTPASAKAARRAERRDAQARRKRRAARERRRALADAAGREEDEAWDSDTTESSSDSSSLTAEGGGGAGRLSERERQVALSKWAGARGWAGRVAGVEVVAGLVWVVAVGAAIAVGGTCPEGDYNDWCLYYNFTLAMAVLTALAWWVCAALGIATLRRTKTPPFADEASARLMA